MSSVDEHEEMVRIYNQRDVIDQLRKDASISELFEALDVRVYVQDGTMSLNCREDEEGLVPDAVVRFDAENGTDFKEYLAYGGGDMIDGQIFKTAEFEPIRLRTNWEWPETELDTTQIQPAVPIPDSDRECRCESCLNVDP
ncbi:hypothetical protein JCM5350_008212 [Sporobolomyces pararoseus]